MNYDLKGHTSSQIVLFCIKCMFSYIYFVKIAILSKVYMNVALCREYLFHKMKYDLKVQKGSQMAILDNYILIIHSSTNFVKEFV